MSSERNQFLLYMFLQDIENMKKWVLQYPNEETGGDLFGLWSGEGDNAVIHVVLGPGRDCTHGAYHFYQDVDYLEKVGSLLTEDYMLGHIGEWHSHHQLQLDRPSEGDCRTIQRNFPKGSCGFFLMIANIVCKEEVSFSPYLFEEGSRRGKAGEVQVIAERSPFAMVTKISQIIKVGKEAEPRKEKEKEGRKEKNIFLTEDTKSTTMAAGSRGFSSSGLYGMQNNREGLTGVDSRSTMMIKEYIKVRLPANSDFQWYSKEENLDLLLKTIFGLQNVFGKVEITFKEHKENMEIEFDYNAWKIRLCFGSLFPISAATLYVNDRYTNTFHLNRDNYSTKAYDLSKFLKEVQDYFQTHLGTKPVAQ